MKSYAPKKEIYCLKMYLTVQCQTYITGQDENTIPRMKSSWQWPGPQDALMTTFKVLGDSLKGSDLDYTPVKRCKFNFLAEWSSFI